MAEMTHKERAAFALADMRTALSAMHANLKELAAERDPELGPELTITMRQCEEFRMRCGFTEAIARGHDPMANKVEERK